MKMDIQNFTTDMPVIGFTGALGSGCTYLAKGLEKHHKYHYCSLSEPVHFFVKKEGKQETTENLQDAGNFLRKDFGFGCLARFVVSQVNRDLKKLEGDKRPVGVIIDGIRNIGEVEFLQQLPNFYLISVQAGTSIRKQRTIGEGVDKRFATEKEFNLADRRDRDEQTEYGQQVKKCNYLSDIIVINDEDEEVAVRAEKPYKDYINKILYENYISLIEHIAHGGMSNEKRARPEEALMTAAYVESKRSSCLKRKVGAVIASSNGDIIAAGHNEVPETANTCIDDPRYGRCARDFAQEEFGQNIKNCPNCGEKIKIQDKCKKCGKEINEFCKRCPQCKSTVEIEYECPKCKKNVFQFYLPGSGDSTGKLLDMCRALHAEENAILNLSKLGVRLPHIHKKDESELEGCVLYSTTFPCNLCANKIVTVGIKKVVYAEPYTMEEAKKVFEKEKVIMERFQGVKSRAYFRLYS
jgi:deoxycytidylate deaminase/dephospho-CoA kinase